MIYDKDLILIIGEQKETIRKRNLMIKQLREIIKEHEQSGRVIRVAKNYKGYPLF